MRNHWIQLIIFVGLAVGSTSWQAQAQTPLVPAASEWKYFKGLSEASEPDITAWRNVGFDDSGAGWLTGQSPFFYENSSGFTGNTDLTDMFGGYTGIYMRHTFNLASAAAMETLTLNVQSDDGCIVWINGVEVLRINVPIEQPLFNDVSGGAAGEPNEATETITDLSMLVDGDNVLAIHALNSSAGSSSDFIIEAWLDGTIDDVPPQIESIDPLPGSIVLDLTFVNVVFDSPVVGVDASDLLINGLAVASINPISPLEFEFTFPQPPTGTVQLAWALNNGITDASPLANPFAGGDWTYTLDPNASTRPNLIISEFMAWNTTGIEDEDGKREDWIEILNLGPLEANLKGWFLTDDSGVLTKWEFPDLILPANNFLLVWASGNDRRDPAHPLHANFGLSNGGEYLALVDPATNVVSEFNVINGGFPPQTADISYGRDVRDLNLLGFFEEPTPGEQNATSGAGFALPPTLSLESGVYADNSLTLVITPAPDTTVRYATNGVIPSSTSPLAPGSITFSQSADYRFRAFPSDPNLFPSPVVSRSFVMLDPSAANFTSKLPLLIMSTHGGSIPQNVPPGGARRPGTLAVFDTFRGRSSFQLTPDYLGLAEYEIFGQTSAGFAKQPHNIEIQDELGNDNSVSILGLPAEADWKLRNPYSDKVLMNEILAFDAFEEMGQYSVRRRLVEVFRDTGGVKVTYPGDYYGVMVLLEKIERGKNRVDITELTPTANSEPEISGGYMFKKDKASGGDKDFNTAGGGGHSGVPLKVHEPKPREITDPQFNWLRNYLNTFEQSMYASDWLTRTGTNHYWNYIDADSFVAAHWAVEFPKQIDGYRISNYYHKDRGGKIVNAPIWDWNLAWGNANYLDGGNTNGWYYTQLGQVDHIWLRRMINGGTGGNDNTGDPEFNQKIADKWSELRTNIFNGPTLLNRIGELETLLTEAANRDNAKYNTWGINIWPNPNGPPTWDVDYQNPTTYAALIDQLRLWVSGRFAWVDSQFLQPPVMGLAGGEITPGFNLTLSAPGGGTIYYRTDGQDPRAPGGSVRPGSQTFSGSITLNDNARVVARARAAGAGYWKDTWSGPVAGTFVVATPPLIITEMMYHPQAPALGDTNDVNNFEYIELKNIGTETLNLAGFKFVNGITFDFTTGSIASLNAGQSLLVVNDIAAFTSRHGARPNIAGEYVGGLANDGERVTLLGPMEEVVHDFTYDDDWYLSTDGVGFSLVVADENQDRAAWGTAAGWRPSNNVGGSPGTGNSTGTTIPGILITEALTHTDLPDVDSIELYNPTDTSVSVAGWWLSDDLREPKFQIPAGTVIPAFDYLVFDEYDFNANPGVPPNFNLRSSGDEVYLFSGNGAGELTGYIHGFDFGASLNGISFGRYVNSQGDEHFVAQSANSLGDANVGPKVGPIVISEIMYRPKDVFVNNALWNNTEDEFVELHNITGAPVPLFDPNATTNTWRLRDAVTYLFPENTTLAPDERVLVVSFDPADTGSATAFRAKYGLDGGTRLFGPFQGQLSNSGEDVELIQPDLVRFYTTNIVITGVLIDKVDYMDVGSWPLAADGIGSSLQRLVETDYGNDPLNWVGANPSPGAGYVPGPAPVIVAQPTSTMVVATLDTSFSVLVSGAGPFAYQWLANGTIIPDATNATLILTGVKPEQAGEYRVVVLNSANSVSSEAAILDVLIPANIVLQPQSQTVELGDDVTFKIGASSSTPITYQWRKDGVEIPGATSATYTFSNADASHRGGYDVLVTDSVGTISSDTAILTVLVPPIVVHPLAPMDLKVVQGQDIVIGVEVSRDTTVPLSYRWRRGFRSTQVVTNNNYSSYFFLSNVQPPANFFENNITVTINNQVGLGVTVTNKLTVLLDSDGDFMSDEFEQAYGLLDNDASDKDLDPDEDGMTNYEESIAGTNPNDGLSYLKVDEVTTGAGVAVVFHALANKSYTIQYKNDLSDAMWQRLADVTGEATDRTVTVSDEDGSPLRIYRLATPQIDNGEWLSF